jgi:hypothetical protein
MASIMEIAARNELLKQAGHTPVEDFVERFGRSSEVPPPSRELVNHTPSSHLPPVIRARRAPRSTGTPQPPESAISLPPKFRK